MLLSSAYELKSRLIVLCESPESHQTFFLKNLGSERSVEQTAGTPSGGNGMLGTDSSVLPEFR